jgi:catecholate siderophore receptor
MFSEITSSRQNDVGNRLANVPMHTANLWTTYRQPWDIEVGGGVNYVSSRYASSTPTAVGGVNFLRKAPGYATLDAMAKYEVNEQIALQLNIYNIADTFYYDGIHPSHVIPGAGRTALFTVTTRF